MLLEELPAFVAGDVTRAASLPSAVKRIGWKLWSTREGVGETSGQPVGSYNGSLAHPANDPAEEWFGNETFFIRRGDRVSTVTGGAAAVGFDPDVFADALVFFARRLCSIGRARCFRSTHLSIAVAAPHRLVMPAVPRA